MDVRVGVLTVSDRVSRGEMEDAGGVAIESVLAEAGAEIAVRDVVADDVAAITTILTAWADDLHLDVVFTTGGTGLGPRDVTPEATLATCSRPVPGISDAIRRAGLEQTPQAILSRGVAAIRGATLVINLPGSPRGARQGAEVSVPILEHAVAIMHGGRH